MSRSGYTDDGDNLNLYRAAVDRAIAGKRGQTFLKELATAMDDMPEKKLIAHELVTEQGEMCTLGVVWKLRGLDPKSVDLQDADKIGEKLGIARSMAAEIEYMNDEHLNWHFDSNETPEQRWIRMRKWVSRNLKTEAAP